ncbi:hypothetical protein FQA47_009041 [Oryzias melastigma]|uniref:Uncharacterized protein n=1 Tax=Oryzias melastigma TaxID=30732 RepID=A0A834F728_ORYME|nr:hypothetical protein FQA47_009041 [Oryzias melastigma]
MKASPTSVVLNRLLRAPPLEDVLCLEVSSPPFGQVMQPLSHVDVGGHLPLICLVPPPADSGSSGTRCCSCPSAEHPGMFAPPSSVHEVQTTSFDDPQEDLISCVWFSGCSWLSQTCNAKPDTKACNPTWSD